ncbi:hypothetical protein [Nocardioides cynanchi]|uniref:hypothetical protein n=1 Tax=Nocardioides cynanchi TaxID=2558918 RepID=UPI0012484262|nr:hypothetical protein [Nocardioides cynanchi]
MSSPGVVSDFDLNGLVGVRVVDGSPSDVAVVRRQLGHPETVLRREPDVTIRFVERLARVPLTLVGVGESGYDDEAFYLLQAKGGSTRRTMMPFDRLGPGTEIVCERGISAVPHLLAIVNLVLLGQGVLPLHATAFDVEGVGVLITGWSKGGKTEALLAATSLGARYVGDEWVHLTPDGRMLGLPEPIRLWAWQLDQRPDLLASRAASDRRRLRMWAGVARTADRVAGRPWRVSAPVRRLAPALGRQAYLQVPPDDLFGPDGMVASAPLDAVVLVLSHEAPQTAVQQAQPGEIARRMAASLSEERAPLMTHYRQFRYAFPDRSSPLLESVHELEARLLSERLDHVPSAKVTHPHPCDIHELGRVVLEAVRDARTRN